MKDDIGVAARAPGAEGGTGECEAAPKSRASRPLPRSPTQLVPGLLRGVDVHSI